MVLQNGNLLLAWSKFTAAQPPDQRLMSSDNATAHIAGMISTDGGCTWQDERVLVENTAGLNVMSPALVRLTDGRLGLAYSYRESRTTAYRLFRHSHDGGETWSDPVFITRHGYKTGCHDHLSVLSCGRIIAPLHCTDDWETHYLHARVAWSDDHGETWQLSEAIELPRVIGVAESGCMEPDVVQRSDRSLLLIIRTAMGTLFKCESYNRGETWSVPHSMEVTASIAPARIVKLPNREELVLIWNWNYDPGHPLGGLRRPMALAVSEDGGRSWPLNRRFMLETDAEFTYAYPSCLPLHDHLFLTYYVAKAANGLGHERSLASQRVPYDVILDRRICSD